MNGDYEFINKGKWMVVAYFNVFARFSLAY